MTSYPSTEVNKLKELDIAIENTLKQFQDAKADLNFTENKVAIDCAEGHKLSSNELVTYEEKLSDLRVVVPHIEQNLENLKQEKQDLLNKHTLVAM